MSLSTLKPGENESDQIKLCINMLRQSSDDRKLAVKLNNKYEDANEARLHWTSDEIP